MKRDMDLIRRILLYVEENGTYDGIHSPQITVDGYSSEQIGYHVHLMTVGGLLDITDDTTTLGDPTYYYLIGGMTWDGHDFLDSIRDDGVWNHTREAIKSMASVPFDVIKGVAVAYMSSKLGL